MPGSDKFRIEDLFPVTHKSQGAAIAVCAIGDDLHIGAFRQEAAQEVCGFLAAGLP